VDVIPNGRQDVGYFERLLDRIQTRFKSLDPATIAWVQTNVASEESVIAYLRSNLRAITHAGTQATAG